MEKFTKGEWVFDGVSTIEANNEVFIDVCSCSSSVSDDEIIANINLIEAAPKMYKILKQVENLVNIDGGDAIGWIIDNHCNVRDLLEQARGD